MTRFLTLLFMTVFAFTLTAMAQNSEYVKHSFGYNYDQTDSVEVGLQSIRGVYYDDDLLGDGVGAVVATNYFENGVVHVFKVAGDDSLEMVWRSPISEQSEGGSTPRYPLFGDLDNDGLKEVIFQLDSVGVLIYEWDGVEGSYNFGTEPSQIIDDAWLAGIDGYLEYIGLEDIDGDEVNEIYFAYNESDFTEDAYYVLSAQGNWSTNTPGISGFNVEFEEFRAAHGVGYGWGGSPFGMYGAQLDGEGNREILIHNWNNKNVTPLRVTGPDTYEMADTTNDKGHYFLSEFDDVALMGAISYDIDSDGREEVYLPSYYYADASSAGDVHMVHYEEGDDVSEIDSTNSFLLDMESVIPSTVFGYGYGDIDVDGNPNLYFSGGYGYNVVTAEFLGGDKLDPANWNFEVIYEGDEETHLTEKAYYDSAGVQDTSFTYLRWPFVSKMFAKNTDFDDDGYEDMILPYQTVYDSIDVYNYTWLRDTSYTRYDTLYAGTDSMMVDTVDVYNSIWDTVATAEVNPKRWSLRVIEATMSTGIEAKDVAVVTPEDYKLKQNYPNPFNPTTNIEFYLPVKKQISLTIYNTLGQKVKTLLDNKVLQRGNHVTQWNGTNEAGAKVASGMYIYELKYGNFTKQKRMMLVK